MVGHTAVRRYGHRDVTFDNGHDDPVVSLSGEYTTSTLTSGKDAVMRRTMETPASTVGLHGGSCELGRARTIYVGPGNPANASSLTERSLGKSGELLPNDAA
jgi:hypothetical protein